MTNPIGLGIPQIYRLDPLMTIESLKARVQDHGGQVFTLDGAKMTAKAQLLQEFATILNFPNYFGQNWDALHDCLCSACWLESGDWGVLAIERWEQCSSPQLIAVLQDAVAEWVESGDGMYVVLQTQQPDALIQQLPVWR